MRPSWPTRNWYLFGLTLVPVVIGTIGGSPATHATVLEPPSASPVSASRSPDSKGLLFAA